MIKTYKLLFVILIINTLCIAKKFDILNLSNDIKKRLNKNSTISYLDSALNSFGYFNHTLKADTVDGSIIIKGNAKERFTIKEIRFVNNKNYSSEKLLYTSDIKTGAYFSSASIYNGIKNILKLYENNGYPFCNISIDTIYTKKTDVFITLLVEENLNFFFNKISIKGNKATKRKTIMREILIKDKMPFSEKLINKSIINLERTGFFEEVNKPQISAHSHRRWIDVCFNVKEKKTVEAQGILGYVKSEDSLINPWTGSGNFRAVNILGTGREGALDFKYENLYNMLNLSYKEPWIFNKNFDAYLSLKILIEKLDYSSIETFLKLTWRVNNSWNFSAIAQKSDLTKTDIGILSKSYGGGGSLTWYSSNYKNSQTIGDKIETSVVLHSKNKQNKTYKEYTYTTRYQKTSPLNKKFATYWDINTQNIISPQQILLRYEKIRLGGTRTIRGYTENQFSARHAFWSRAELRFLLNKKSSLHLFSDQGFISWNTKDTNNKITIQNKTLWGYGIGFSVPSHIGNIGVDIGANKETNFKAIKIHANIKTYL